jgi:hypothetical protein
MNKTDPPWNLKILGVPFTKNVKILQIAGSRAELLDFVFLIYNFFLKTGYNTLCLCNFNIFFGKNYSKWIIF